MKNKLLFLAVMALFLPNISLAETVACPTDAMLCPDGTYVGRSGPDCKFVCPGSRAPDRSGNPTDSSNSGPSKTIRDEIEQKKEAVRNTIEERRQNASEKIRGRIDQFIQNVKERFEAAVNRLEILAGRIESRIAKIEARNIKVEEAKKLLGEAKKDIETARISVTAISFQINIASSTATTTIALMKEAFKTTKDQIEKAKKDLKTAHASLVDVINSLKPGDNKLRGLNATSTATTTDDSD